MERKSGHEAYVRLVGACQGQLVKGSATGNFPLEKPRCGNMELEKAPCIYNMCVCIYIHRVDARKLEHGRPPTATPKKGEERHESSYIHVPRFWSLLCTDRTGAIIS